MGYSVLHGFFCLKWLTKRVNYPSQNLLNIITYNPVLKTKIIKERLDTAIASESSLEKDWLKPEEDEA
ncbi:MAG: hypothetical protein HBSIN01_30180 [Candidatus Brocadia sinica]|uniref:hypothetical protein n=1 Tax=Candidatus Brocadia sp. AMX2 TaxID=2293635 RepID=UPI00179118FD|nr:hypothetical protein [Candidatus Brocadia sp. AMX2]NOG40698.1 DUF2281 domain-containing protein [Planctomycetota bacterium]GIK13330.1 MAG: hypothetical protein BroJett002_20370 [Candidatus Brocadia sinica]GJQ19059.1 MAG: hypothetical protein HBSIN01_30180 [Candidatus Brocadia sinica]